MKNILIITIALLTICCTTSAQQVEHIMLNFNADDYSISDGRDYIIDKHYRATYLEDTQLPAIPFVPIQVKLPVGYDYADMSFTSIKQFFAENVLLENNPECVPTDSVYERKIVAQHNYPEGIYPKNNVIYTGRCDYGNVIVATFMVSPWVYDSERGILELMTNINLDIQLKPRPKNELLRRPSELSSLLDLIVVNPDKTSATNRTEDMPRTASGYDYVIITSPALSSAFNPLKQWKTMKGVRTKIVTVPEIDQQYTDSTIQLKIKHYLYDCFQNEGLKYVLLGGDDTVVPVQRCSISFKNYIEPNMPTDLYYTCFAGAFNWDGNINGVYGEFEDNVDFTPSVFVTRLPVRTVSDASSIVYKILNYEQMPSKNGWNNNLLMGGAKSYTICNSMSDAQIKSDSIYREVIAPYWNGTRIQFFDTYTDMPGGSSYQFNTTNIQNELSKGYTFVDISTHGGQHNWKTEVGVNYFHTDALSLINNKPTIITTTACYTNAFDSIYPLYTIDPCLSEAFIRNPNSGVMAYLGCSRFAWTMAYDCKSFGPAEQFDSDYYSFLYSNNVREKNWGKIVALAKDNNKVTATIDTTYRWTQFGLNPIGDPEMPVFVNTPQELTSISVSSTETGFSIHFGERYHKVCLMSCNDNGNSFYQVYYDVENINLSSLTQNVSICITKQGYIPKIFIAGPQGIFVQNEKLAGSFVFEGNRVSVGENVTNLKSSGTVNVTNANIIIKGHEINLCPGTTIDIGTTFEAIGQ